MDSQGLLARRSPLPTPFAPRIIGAQNLRTTLPAVAHAHATPHALAVRARSVVRAAEVDTPTTGHSGRALPCAKRTVGTWRRRSHALGLAGLHEAPRAGRPRPVPPRPRVTRITVASQ
jgi:hypothetical protein